MSTFCATLIVTYDEYDHEGEMFNRGLTTEERIRFEAEDIGKARARIRQHMTGLFSSFRLGKVTEVLVENNEIHELHFYE